SPVLKPFFFLLPKSQLQVEVHVGGELVDTLSEGAEPQSAQQETPATQEEEPADAELPSGTHSYRIEELAYTRSGDKGDASNIGVIARHPAFYPYLKKHLTSSVVEDYFSHLIQPGTPDPVARDPQGKAYGQMLLDLKLTGLPDLMSLVD
ncbi:hypothetical protein CRUP_003978, partial [Coryphaenoides rupestris]